MMMWRFCFLCCLVLGFICLVSSKSISREQRDISHIPQLAASNKQIGGGLSALGTLVSPLLFLMGMGSFISMLPQMFQTVLSGVGSNLIQSFTGGGANSGGSSTRLKRDVLDEKDLLREIEKRINLAVLKYEGQLGV